MYDRVRSKQSAAIQRQSNTRQEAQAEGDMDKDLSILCKISFFICFNGSSGLKLPEAY